MNKFDVEETNRKLAEENIMLENIMLENIMLKEKLRRSTICNWISCIAVAIGCAIINYFIY